MISPREADNIVEHYIWEIAWRSGLQMWAEAESFLIVAIKFAGMLFWFDGKQESSSFPRLSRRKGS